MRSGTCGSTRPTAPTWCARPETVALSTIEDLYAAAPPLEAAENALDARLEERREVLALVAPGGVGAELGVFTGRFAAFLAEVTQPSTLHLVDPWWLEWGETFPDWGPYTDFGRLPTRVAHQAVQLRLARHAGTEIHVERASDWLGKLDDGALDWAYLDTTHVFEDTRQELDAIGPKLNADGLLLGDDWVPDRSHPHHGIFLAVHDRIRDAGWELVYGDRHGQWAARPGPATARR